MQTQVSLADCLIERQMLSGEEMERVRQLQEEQQAPLSRLVVELGFLSEEDLLPVMRDHFDLPLMSLRDVPNTPLPIDLPANIGDFFKLARMVPVKIDGRDLIVAIADPMELSRLHAIELATGLRVKAVLAQGKRNRRPYRSIIRQQLHSRWDSRGDRPRFRRYRQTMKTSPICATWPRKCRSSGWSIRCSSAPSKAARRTCISSPSKINSRCATASTAFCTKSNRRRGS